MSHEVRCSVCKAVQGRDKHKLDCPTPKRGDYDPSCRTCWIGGFMMPTHNGSVACRQARRTTNGSIAAGGTITHCTCAGCF